MSVYCRSFRSGGWISMAILPVMLAVCSSRFEYTAVL